MGRSPGAFVSHGACRRLQDGHRQSGMIKYITFYNDMYIMICIFDICSYVPVFIFHVYIMDEY